MNSKPILVHLPTSFLLSYIQPTSCDLLIVLFLLCLYFVPNCFNTSSLSFLVLWLCLQSPSNTGRQRVLSCVDEITAKPSASSVSLEKSSHLGFQDIGSSLSACLSPGLTTPAHHPPTPTPSLGSRSSIYLEGSLYAFFAGSPYFLPSSTNFSPTSQESLS